MESKKLKNNNETYLYRDESFNTISITLNFLTSSNNRSCAVGDVLRIYLLECNKVYKTSIDINERSRELYESNVNFYKNWKGNKNIFCLRADLISMNVVGDDYSKDIFEYIRDLLKQPDFENEEVLEFSKRKMLARIERFLSDNNNYVDTLYGLTVVPNENMRYDYETDKKYIENLINSVTLEDLKNEYNYIINHYINGLVFGNISEEQFNCFVDYINLKPINNDLDYSYDVKTTEGDIEVEKDCEQSYIYVTYDFTDLTNAEYRILQTMLNSSIGLCYETLREKYGLVYGAYADLLFHQKKLNISGETDISKKQKFIEACDEIIESLKNREIVEMYMNQAKEEIASDEYVLSEDKSDLVEVLNNRILKVYGDKDRDLVTKEIEEMKPEDLINKTKTLVRKNVFTVRRNNNE